MIHRRLRGSRPRIALWGALALLAIGSIPGFVPAPASAADPILLTVAPRILTATDKDTFLIVVPPRPDDAVRADRQNADEVRGVEEARLREAIDQETGIKLKIEAEKKEVEALKAKIKVAKDEKNSADQQKLEHQVEVAEGRLDLMKKRAEVRAAERELTEATKDAANALVHYFDAELELINKRAAEPPPSLGAQDDASLERRLRFQGEVQELERKALETILAETDKREDALKKERDLLEKRLELFEAQNAARKAKGK